MKGASETAFLVAKGVWLASCEPRLSRFVDPETAFLAREILVRLGSPWARLARFPEFRRMAFAVEQRVLPGICLHYCLRKRFIDVAVRGRLRVGADRVIVLGAGLDTLSLRLARRYAGLSLIEVDHPATQAQKRGAVEGFAGLDRVQFVSADLAGGIEALFTERNAETVFVMEGLLMYLPPAVVEGLFRQIAATAWRKTVVFSAMALGPDGLPGFESASGYVSKWLAQRREPFLWGIKPSETRTWLDRKGFDLEDHADQSRLRLEFCVPSTVRLASGEQLYSASSKNVK